METGELLQVRGAVDLDEGDRVGMGDSGQIGGRPDQDLLIG